MPSSPSLPAPSSLSAISPNTPQSNPPAPTESIGPGALSSRLTLRNGFKFRKGQEQFLVKLAAALARGESNHLGVFVPGYGKTITALASFAIAHAMDVAKKLVVFVPRGNLRDQYADPAELSRLFFNIGAPPFTFCVADSEKVFLKNLDTNIIITTYQYASGRGGHKALLRFCSSAPCMFVFDEVHHLSDDGTWAQRIAEFPHTSSVALSGTPMRSDNKTLFGVPFETRLDGEQYYTALHEVTMRDAHSEGRILKRVNAHIVDYRLTMVRSDTGRQVEMSLSKLAEIARDKQDVDAFLARKKLRFHDVYLESLLAPAFKTFAEKRQAMSGRVASNSEARNHQMLVIAMSNGHAAAILDFIRRRFPDVAVDRIGQDVPASDRAARLAAYREGKLDVMVQVDMIGEGTDIKPISVIVKADLVRAWSKTMQQVFRGMRYFNGFPANANVCDIYAANDSQVVATLEWITSEERLGIKWKQELEDVERGLGGAPTESMWELKDVEHQDIRSHAMHLELFPEYASDHRTPDEERELRTARRGAVASEIAPDPRYVSNVSQREAELRNECANLASRLSRVLRGRGVNMSEAVIHAEAKRRFAKAQEELSIRELTKKQSWLVRCIDAKKLLAA